MKFILSLLLLFCAVMSYSQDRLNPVVSPFGGIYDIPQATVKADPNLEYKIIIDVATGNDDPSELNWALNNVARLINLHAISGANPKNMDVVLAIHGGATYAIADSKTYEAKYQVNNPNLELIKTLAESGVKLTVCGQSLKAREISTKNVNENVQIATSMLTTVTTHQLKGYAYLKF